MDLSLIASGITSAVNPQISVTAQISIGSVSNSDATATPQYATPGEVMASIGGTFTGFSTGAVLTIQAGSNCFLQPGDLISGTDGTNSFPAGTVVLSQLTGNQTGGAGTYQLNQGGYPSDVTSCPITALGDTLTVQTVGAGVLQPGQTISDVGGFLLPNTTIVAPIPGPGPARYQVSAQQTVGFEIMTAALNLTADIQPVTWRDIQQLNALNIQGVRWKAYLFGEVDGLVRPESKGGDLIVIPPGVIHSGTWLVAQILEQWQDWVCAAITLQNGG